jgi:very-short-patch-repair endonuclease
VLRFWSNEVMGDLDMVLGTIFHELDDPGSSFPSG